MKLILLALLITAGCISDDSISQKTQSLCSVEDQQNGNCPNSAWLLSYTEQWGYSYVSNHYPGVSYASEGGGCTDIGGGETRCHWHYHVGALECDIYCDDDNGDAQCSAYCH